MIEERANIMHKERVEVFSDLFPVGELKSPFVRDPVTNE
jgi:hypothetical protein